MSAPTNPPPLLARFPADVSDAYERFRSTGDAEAVHIVVGAALIDFLPRHKDGYRMQPPGDDARLMDDLGYDSLAIAELVFFFEDLFKVTISSQEIRHVGTVGELRAFVTRKLEESRRST